MRKLLLPMTVGFSVTIWFPAPGNPWLGFRITKAGGKAPVLKDYQGPYCGDVLRFSGAAPRQAELPVVPGKYSLELVLRQEGSSYSLVSHDNLWSAKVNVKVVSGRYTVIDIPRRKAK